MYLKIGTLRSDNVDVHENITSTSMKSPRLQSQGKAPWGRGWVGTEERGPHPRVQTEVVEFIALLFPFKKNLKFEVLSSGSCAGTAKKCTRKG